MLRIISLTTLLLSLSPLTLASPSLEEQEACLDAAAARYSLARESNQENFLKAIESCDGAGPSGFSDRCYAIGARKFEKDTWISEQNYKAEKAACLR